MAKVRTVALGSFTVDGGGIVVTDPCYEPGTWCASPPLPARDGEWSAEVSVGGREGRVMELRAFGPGFDASLRSERGDFEVGVDSGQAGVFSAARFKGGRDEAFYEACCAATLSAKQGGVVAGGCVSATGFGDGGYRARLWRDAAGLVCGVQVVFIPGGAR